MMTVKPLSVRPEHPTHSPFTSAPHNTAMREGLRPATRQEAEPRCGEREGLAQGPSASEHLSDPGFEPAASFWGEVTAGPRGTQYGAHSVPQGP